MLLSSLLVSAAYLSGAVPYGLLLGRRHGVDIRRVGSGNIGATNVRRALGWRAALWVLLLDAAKGAAPVALALVLGEAPAVVALCMTAAVVGHCYPIFLAFRGGKGVATALGVTAVTIPAAAAIGLVVYAGALALVRVSAVGSLAGVAAALLVAFVGGATATAYQLALVAIALVVAVRHRGNLRRDEGGRT